MKINESKLKNLFILEYNSFKDQRGEFVKTIHNETFIENGIDYAFKESFFSISHKNVLRGIHFQYQPNDHAKLVYAITGSILDVVIDLRKSSNTYGAYFSIELSAKNRKALYIGSGFGHGFLSLEDNSLVEYHTTTSQNKNSEGGIKWNSFGYDWPVANPIISERDNSFDNFIPTNNYFL